jgi:hypothetical protein
LIRGAEQEGEDNSRERLDEASEEEEDDGGRCGRLDGRRRRRIGVRRRGGVSVTSEEGDGVSDEVVEAGTWSGGVRGSDENNSGLAAISSIALWQFFLFSTTGRMGWIQLRGVGLTWRVSTGNRDRLCGGRRASD